MYQYGEQVVCKKKKKIKKIVIGIVLSCMPFLFLISLTLSMAGGADFYASNAVDGNLSDEDNEKMLSVVKSKTEWINNESTYDEAGNKIGNLCDYYGTESRFKLNWAYLLAYLKYKQIDSNDTTSGTLENVEKRIEEAAKEIAPKFTYKKDKIITDRTYKVVERVKDKETVVIKHEINEEERYFITDIMNIQGHYEIKYGTNTIVSYNGAGESITTTKPVIKSITQIDKNYDNLKSILTINNIGGNVKEDSYAIIAGADCYLEKETTIDENLLDTGTGTFTGIGLAFSGDTKAFVDKVLAAAQKQWNEHNILPSITVAQGILESTHGKSLLTVKANNLFGVKAFSSWTGPYVEMLTREEDESGNSFYITAKFRAYNSWDDSVADHSRVLLQSNFKAVRDAKDYMEAARALQSCGYATDTNYANKVISIIEQYGLNKYDKK